MDKFIAAVMQTEVLPDKEKNLNAFRDELNSGRLDGADIIILPEMWMCPYSVDNFRIYAEPENGKICRTMSELAAKHNVNIAAGSMPEIDDKGKIYNTAYVFDRAGKQIAKHRKAHLFDINVKGGQIFCESDVLSAGNSFDVFKTDMCAMGLAICYDFRFPEAARMMTLAGADVIIVPAAFNMTTGPAHWELMFRQRAVENQIYAIAAAPARDKFGKYVSYGHSLVSDPWGRVIYSLEEKPGVLMAEIDLALLRKIRKEMPLLLQRREDIYKI